MVGVIGLGFVGLTTALGLAAKGCKVFGYDLSVQKTTALAQGKVPFYEPHLPEILSQVLNRDFYLCHSLAQLVKSCRLLFYCVGTPSDPDGAADLSLLIRALEDTLTIMQDDYPEPFRVVVVKSTVPPTTASRVLKPLLARAGYQVGRDIGLASNPEFLREGRAWDDFMHPDRIVIGVEDSASWQLVEELYQPFQAPIYRMSLTGAEFLKYLSNTLLATMISFANEMSMVAHRLGEVDIPQAFRILHQDKRWFGAPAPMSTYVYPGCGFGGYCLPKDLAAMCHQADRCDYEPTLLQAVAATNAKIKEFVVEKIIASVKKDDKFGIIGLSFKPDSDDVRESPAAEIITLLLKNGFTNITAHDPIAIDNFKRQYCLPIKYESNLNTLVDSVDYLVLLTAWDDYKMLKSTIPEKKMFDFRYC